MVALSLPRFCDRQVADISDPASRVEVESLSDDLIKIIISVNVGNDTVVVDFVQVSKSAFRARAFVRLHDLPDIGLTPAI